MTAWVASVVPVTFSESMDPYSVEPSSLLFQDEFGSVARLQELVDAIQSHNASVELQVIKGADHFFEGHLEELKQVITEWSTRQF